MDRLSRRFAACAALGATPPVTARDGVATIADTSRRARWIEVSNRRLRQLPPER